MLHLAKPAACGATISASARSKKSATSRPGARTPTFVQLRKKPFDIKKVMQELDKAFAEIDAETAANDAEVDRRSALRADSLKQMVAKMEARTAARRAYLDKQDKLPWWMRNYCLPPELED